MELVARVLLFTDTGYVDMPERVEGGEGSSCTRERDRPRSVWGILMLRRTPSANIRLYDC